MKKSTKQDLLFWFAVILIILAASFGEPSKAGQVSYQESTLINSDVFYSTSADRRLQVNFDTGDNYFFLQYRKAGICPYYCGFNYDMFGAGYGVRHKIGVMTLFAQAGYYFIKNSVGVTKYDENLYYFLTEKFGNHPEFKSYEVTNDNAPGVTVGMDIPLGRAWGIGLAYQYMKVKENIIGRFTNDPKSLNLWWNPKNRDLSTISAKIYFNY